MAKKKIMVNISGMTCAHCEKRVANAVRKLNGVEAISASFPRKCAEITYNTEKVSEKAIKDVIENEGYKVTSIGDNAKRQPVGKVIPIFLIVLAIYFIAKYTIGFDFINLIPRIDSTVSLIALFAVGFFTSVHCIAMCGGINLSQSVSSTEDTSRFRRPFLYNLGRVISYTVIGGIVGGIGSVLFISQTAKGIIMLAAAAFMILMGLSMLGWLPWWLVPRLPKGLSKQANKAKKGKGPFIVGLLNGLLPCGPLQAMQLYALSTGSVITGAFSMLLFSLGTVPLMLGAGLVFSMLKGKFTRGITRVSAVLVVLIAVVMIFNAGGLFGWNLGGDVALAGSPTAQTQASNSALYGSATLTSDGYIVAKVQDGIQAVEANLGSSKYPSIMVQKGIPVQFNIKADDSSINGCNETVEIAKFNIEKKLEAGDNIINFTPNETGTITYTCWMGMIRGQIKVVDSLDNVASAPALTAPAGASPSPEISTAPVSCCSVGGRKPITKDSVAIANIVNGQQTITVSVGDQGYSPAVLVVQKGVKTQIKFDPKQLNNCNGYIVFPELGGTLDLSKNELETPVITPESDFTFTCTMNMLYGYAKVVDDINNVDVDAIVNEVSQYQPQSIPGGGCCG